MITTKRLAFEWLLKLSQVCVFQEITIYLYRTHPALSEILCGFFSFVSDISSFIGHILLFFVSFVGHIQIGAVVQW